MQPILQNGLHSEHRHCVSLTLATQDELKSPPINYGSNHRKTASFSSKNAKTLPLSTQALSLTKCWNRLDTHRSASRSILRLTSKAIVQPVRESVLAGYVIGFPAVPNLWGAFGTLIAVDEHFCDKFATWVAPAYDPMQPDLRRRADRLPQLFVCFYNVLAV